MAMSAEYKSKYTALPSPEMAIDVTICVGRKQNKFHASFSANLFIKSFWNQTEEEEWCRLHRI